MLESLLSVDRALSITINHFHTPWLDEAMVMISDKLTWLPLYLGILLLITRRFGKMNALFIVLLIFANLVLTDQISVLFKESFGRLRPCHAPGVMEHLHLVDGCGGKFSFVSSHATNTMGLAMILSFIMKQRWLSFTMIVWAVLNGYSRIYLGKHYAFDVMGGFMLSSVIAILLFSTFRSLMKRFRPELLSEL